MNMDSLSFLAILIVTAFFLKLLFPITQKRRLTGIKSLKSYRRGANPFNAVSVKSYGEGCTEIEAINGKRFLSEDAPLLPLQDCSLAKCNCRYSHLTDRRTGTGNRRALQAVIESVLASSEKPNRRDSIGRRWRDSKLPEMT